MQCPQGPDHNSMHIRGLAGPAAASESGAATSVWPSKTENFAHSGRETAQERLRNGWSNGRVSAKVTASASPRGDQRSWGVALPSDQASRRSSPVLDKGPPGPFSATLYLKIECRGKRRPSGHPGTGRACPPRCLVRWKCDSPRSFTTSRRSAGHRLGRNSAVSRAVPEPFLSRFSIQMDEFLGF